LAVAIVQSTDEITLTGKSLKVKIKKDWKIQDGGDNSCP
jgi:hypothetical protein